MPRSLVIDKSYARAKPSRVIDLSKNYNLLVPSAFYYEVLTTTPKNRVKELTKYPSFHRINVLSQIQQEKESGQPGPLDTGPPLEVNPATSEFSWLPSAKIAGILKQYEERSLGSWLDYWTYVIKEKEIPAVLISESLVHAL